MLYLIGLGLNKEGISREGLNIVKRCKKIYLENYTVEFPYSLQEIEEIIGKRILPLNREKVESLDIIDEAKKSDIALLVYGSPLTATTHASLVQEAVNSGVKCKIIYSASIRDAVAETGLQLYKFGKTASIPKWQPEKNFTPDSFADIIKENQSINAHTLLLIDIGLDFQEALEQLEKACKNKKFKMDKIVVCSRLGTENSKIFCKTLPELREFHNLRAPYCLIIPGKLHFLEKEFLRGEEN